MIQVALIIWLVPKFKTTGMFADILDNILEWVIVLGLIAAQLALTFALKVPGCPTG